MQILTVVNRMLGTLGEKPLNSLTDTHRFLAACQDKLTEVSVRIQGEGWWYNMEEVTLTPSIIDQAIYLPNDCLEVRNDLYNLTKRGSRVYNLKGGSYEFNEPLDIILIREVLFEEIPQLGASYIAATAVHEFQTVYDGDTAKTRDLAAIATTARAMANAAHTRNRRVNLIKSNYTLQRLKATTEAIRRNQR